MRITVWIARAAIVFTVAGAVVGWLAIGRLGDVFDRSAGLAENAALVAADASASAADLSDDLVDLSESVSAATTQLARITGETELMARQLAESADGAALDTVQTGVSALDDLATLTGTIADLNSSLGALGVPDVGADALADRLRASAASLATVPADLTDIAASLREGATTLETFEQAVRDTQRELDRLVTRLDATSATLGELPARVERLRRDTARLRSEHDGDTALWRTGLLLLGAAFVLGLAGIERLAREQALARSLET